MREFTNNFLRYPKISNPIGYLDYLKVAENMHALHEKCFEDPNHHLKKDAMLSFLKNRKYHVFFNKFSLAILQVIDSEAEIVTLLVDPTRQRKGNGSKLLELISLYLKNLRVEKIFLEVAINNDVAIKTYSKIGFTTCGIRKNYYSCFPASKLDALMMVLNLSRKIGKLNKKKLQRLYPTG